MIGLDLETANAIVVRLLAKYEGKIDDPPEGRILKQLYDLDKSRPTGEYRKVYNRVVSELRDLGMLMEDYPF